MPHRTGDARRDPTETEDAVTELDHSVHGILVPGFVGTEPPGWLRRRIERGLGGVARVRPSASSSVVEAARQVTVIIVPWSLVCIAATRACRSRTCRADESRRARA